MLPQTDSNGSHAWFVSKQARNRFLLHITLLGTVVVTGVILLQREFAFLTQTSDVRQFIQNFEIWAPVVLIILQALQVVFAPIPGQVLAAASGYLFGPWYGTLYNMLGITIGSTIAFWLSRRFGRSYVERILASSRIETFDRVVERHGLLSLFVLFLIPGLPDDVLCFIGGLSPIPLWKLILIAIIGRAPAFFLVNVFGDLVAAGDVFAATLLLAFIIGSSVIGFFHRDQVIAFVTEN